MCFGIGRGIIGLRYGETVKCEEVHLNEFGAGMGLPVKLIDEADTSFFCMVGKYESEPLITSADFSGENGGELFDGFSGYRDASSIFLQKKLDIMETCNGKWDAIRMEILPDEVDGFLYFFAGAFLVGEDEKHRSELFRDINEKFAEIFSTDDDLVFEFGAVDDGGV